MEISGDLHVCASPDFGDALGRFYQAVFLPPHNDGLGMKLHPYHYCLGHNLLYNFHVATIHKHWLPIQDHFLHPHLPQMYLRKTTEYNYCVF